MIGNRVPNPLLRRLDMGSVPVAAPVPPLANVQSSAYCVDPLCELRIHDDFDGRRLLCPGPRTSQLAFYGAGRQRWL